MQLNLSPIRRNVVFCSFLPLTLLTLTLLSGLILTSSTTSATDDSVVDEVNITVPVSCSLSGTSMNTHNANIVNGTYQADIGTTTLKAFCNDNEGFAIYAAGYTGNTIGETNSNKLVGTNASSNATIDTGTATSAGNPDISNWAMKLTAPSSPTPTYPITLDNGFGSYSAVPNSYTKVAHRDSNTDIGTNAEGTTLTTTYAAYISKTQAADTYSGQVKYTLVHPHLAPEPLRDDQIAIEYVGNGLTFENGRNKNRVVYSDTCNTEYGYVDNTYQEVMTSNISTGGEQNGAYADNENILRTITFPDADRIKVVVDYGITNGTTEMLVADDVWDGDWSNYNSDWEDDWLYANDDITGTRIFVVNNNAVTIYADSWGTPESGYDYGFYIKVYPVYDEEVEGATYELLSKTCELVAQIGTYEETITWNGNWNALVDDQTCYPGNGVCFYYGEEEILNYLTKNKERLGGTTLTLYAANSYTIIFDANGGSGVMDSIELYPYTATSVPESGFVIPHQDIVSWNTKADGTGESYPNAPNDSAVYFYEPIAGTKGGESVTLYAQWGDCRPNRVCYDDNGANSPTMMGKSYINRGSNNNLWASNFQRAGYGFAGWNTRQDGTGTSYGPNQDLGDEYYDSTSQSEGVRLYAMWIPSSGNIQNWAGCGSLSIGDVTALTDLRDSNVYAVARLADGNCWMIENLRLESEGTIGDSNKTLAQGYGTSSRYGDFVGLANPESANFTYNTSNVVANSVYYSGTQSGTAIIDIMNSSYPASRMPRYNNENTVAAQSGSNYSTYNATYSMGNYYTWSSAMANTNYYNDTTSTDADGKTSETVNTSLCPTGWRLPYGRNTGRGVTSGGYYYLHTALIGGEMLTDAEASNKWRSYPNNFIFSGSFSGSSAKDRSRVGAYWSSTARSSGLNGIYSYPLHLHANEVKPGTDLSGTNSTGRSIRCVMITN